MFNSHDSSANGALNEDTNGILRDFDSVVTKLNAVSSSNEVDIKNDVILNLYHVLKIKVPSDGSSISLSEVLSNRRSPEQRKVGCYMFFAFISLRCG